MYVDSVVNPIGTNIGNTVTSNVSAASSTKQYTSTDVGSTVRTETPDNDTAQQSVQSKKDAVAYDKPQDNRTNEEKVAADNDKIKKAIENIKAQLPNSEVKFGIHDKTDRVTIKLVDKKTKEVIKEFPPEKTLDMIAKCMEIAGVLVDEKL